MTELTRVLIAEDEPLAAEALADWVARMPSLQLVASCGDGASALAQIRSLQPDLVLMDIQMPVLTGLQVMQALAGDGGATPTRLRRRAAIARRRAGAGGNERQHGRARLRLGPRREGGTGGLVRQALRSHRGDPKRA